MNKILKSATESDGTYVRTIRKGGVRLWGRFYSDGNEFQRRWKLFEEGPPKGKYRTAEFLHLG